ncbi:GSCFA domain-containing protein [Catalinimonas sp. 4WD22]|uniref:GSCFA domain-containing protein n=1 Tax=Catalinimonas locisalis TaxID=3133978 RepID=UPI0031016C17
MFRTPVTITPSSDKLQLSSKVLSIGSCFAQAIGKRLTENKFDAYNNPFGTLFNPASIFNLLIHSLNNQPPKEDSYLLRDNVHYNYNFHSDFASESKEGLQKQIENALSQTHNFLENADWIIITLGTAFYYEKKNNGEIVANCHKMPSAIFEKKILKPEEIQTRFTHFYENFHGINQKARFIFSVSPVRHIRDTLVQNTVSKATLRLAVEEIVQNYPENTAYFPSYELMMDDLRDYRFYKADMIHPTEVAEDYIWEQWVSAYLDVEAREFLKEWEKIKRALAHRSFQPASKQHQQFILKTIEQLNLLSKQVDVRNEVEALKKQLL